MVKRPKQKIGVTKSNARGPRLEMSFESSRDADAADLLFRICVGVDLEGPGGRRPNHHIRNTCVPNVRWKMPAILM
jgi:hypothetical protein